jgi:hypothetical protein
MGGGGVVILYWPQYVRFRGQTVQTDAELPELQEVDFKPFRFVSISSDTSSGVSFAGFRIRIHFLRIRIRIEANTDPDTDPDPDPIRIQSGSRALMTKN